MKQCHKCKEYKSLESFSKNKRKKDGLNNECKECRQVIDREFYHNNKHKRDQVNKKYYDKNKQFFTDYKSKCICAKCRESRTYVLDFHHIDSSLKEDNVSSLTKVSIDKLKKELEKCIPLCRNCHAEFHYFERKKGITIEQYLAG